MFAWGEGKGMLGVLLLKQRLFAGWPPDRYGPAYRERTEIRSDLPAFSRF